MQIQIGWALFAFFLFLIVIGGMACLFQFFKKKKTGLTLNNETVLCFLFDFIIYSLSDFFFMTGFNHWLEWEFVLGCLIIVFSLGDFVYAFLKVQSASGFKRVCSIITFIMWIGVTIYLLYSIPNEYQNLQEILFPFVSGVYGGLITLIGVAWSIRWTYKENEKKRKEEITPFFSSTPYYKGPNLDIATAHYLRFGDSKMNDSAFSLSSLINGDKIEFKVIELQIESMVFPCFYDAMVSKGELFVLCLYGKDSQELGKVSPKEAVLIVQDIDGGILKYRLDINYDYFDPLISNVELQK
jgi:hypothetical protein